MSAEEECAPAHDSRGATRKECGQSTALTRQHDINAAPVVEHALDYCDKGLSIIPAHGITADGSCTCGRPGCSGPGKHPRIAWAGFTKDRPKRELVGDWFNRMTDSNVATVTGAVSDVTIVDIDGPEGEAELAAAGIVLPVTPTVLTGRKGGRQVYCQYDPRLATAVNVLPHVDIRNDGGIAILPPSMHYSGKEYRWAPGLELGEVALARLPEEFVALVVASGAVPKPKTERALLEQAMASVSGGNPARLADEVACWTERVEAAAREGTGRNNALNECAFALGGLEYLGLDRSDVHDTLARLLVCSDFSEREFEATFESGWSAGAAAVRIGVGMRPRYPVDTLGIFAPYVEKAASAAGVPPEMVGPALLAFAGGVAGNGYRLLLEPEGSSEFGCWSERPSLWTLIIAGAGAGKSPALKRAQHFVNRLQRRADAEYAEAMSDYRHAQEQRKRDRSRSAKSIADRAHQPEDEPPVEETYFTTDATVEGLVRALSGSRGVTLALDEARAWFYSLGAYNGRPSGDRAKYLALWSSADPRVTRAKAETLSVIDPVLGWVGGLQPMFAGEFILGDGLADGLPQRLLWVWPEISPDLRPSRESVGREEHDPVAKVFDRLRLPAGWDTKNVRLAPDAQELFYVLDDQCGREAIITGSESTDPRSTLYAGFLAKVPAHVARLALVLHLIEHEYPYDHPVSRATVENALRLIAYHALCFRKAVDHALTREEEATLERVGGRAERLAEKLERTIRDADGEWLSLRDLKARAKLKDAKAVRDAALNILLEDGHIERRETPSHTGATAVEYRWAATTKEEVA